MTAKREPKQGDLWSVDGSILLIYNAGAAAGLGNVIVETGFCCLGGTQGTALANWLKEKGTFLCSLSKLSEEITKL